MLSRASMCFLLFSAFYFCAFGYLLSRALFLEIISYMGSRLSPLRIELLFVRLAFLLWAFANTELEINEPTFDIEKSMSFSVSESPSISKV